MCKRYSNIAFIRTQGSYNSVARYPTSISLPWVRARAPCWLPAARDLGARARTQGSYKAVARYTQGSYNSVAKYSTATNRRQLHVLEASKKKTPPKPCFRAPLHTTYFRVCFLRPPPPNPPSYSAGAGIDTQGNYNSVTRYSTSSSLSVNRSITFTHAQQSTALKSHSCFELI